MFMNFASYPDYEFAQSLYQVSHWARFFYEDIGAIEVLLLLLIIIITTKICLVAWLDEKLW